MRFTQPIEALEAQETELKQQVNGLTQSQKKRFFAEQSRQLKDPDTYAALNWGFLGGIHHLYLRKYGLFVVECVLLVIAIIGLVLNQPYFGLILAGLVLFELPQLFFAQKIARQYNYHVSREIFEHIRRGG
ncbi:MULTISPECIES: hypothetical protein [Salinivibrio]|uniref:TM2 domain-containing protein n=2 Tax=Salinivibrio TaxID=51366 RepID=A0AA47LQI3_9GAMM|nr:MULTISPECIES: hypothetical protein [Salinivibrio]OOE73089.1 hypothetical protein BZG23_12820 [Salinivibrio sp. ML290]OOE88585.1 hypothetical protein BZG74_07695 [Salinivibrio sharmensis]WBA07744.1 hypothetical protein N8M53_07675 [Salinivibrio kushneri]